MKPVRSLQCCCCSQETLGRQWWNRDTGYGLCDKCCIFMENNAGEKENMKENFGIKGVHYAIAE